MSLARHAVLVSGDPATGKSTLGARLAPRIDATLLDLDVATGPLTDLVAAMSGHRDLSDPALAALTRVPRYATLFDLAQANLGTGRSVVLIAPFTAERRDRTAWDSARNRLEAAGGRVTLLWLHLPAEDLLARMRSRAAGRDTARLDDPDRYLAGLPTEPPVGPHVALDSRRAVDDLVAELAHRFLP